MLIRPQHDLGHDDHGISSSADMTACHCVSVIGGGGGGSSSSSPCSSVLWVMRAYMARISDIAQNIASFTVGVGISRHRTPQVVTRAADAGACSGIR